MSDFFQNVILAPGLAQMLEAGRRTGQQSVEAVDGPAGPDFVSPAELVAERDRAKADYDRVLVRLVELEGQCDALRAQVDWFRAQAADRVAAFTAQNVRPLDDEKPGFPVRAIAPRRDDPRRLGAA